MLGRIFMLISIVVVVQPLSFCNITSSDQKHPAFTIYTVSYTFTILLLLTVPAQVECILGIVFVGTNFLSKENVMQSSSDDVLKNLHSRIMQLENLLSEFSFLYIV